MSQCRTAENTYNAALASVFLVTSLTDNTATCRTDVVEKAPWALPKRGNSKKQKQENRETWKTVKMIWVLLTDRVH